MLVHAKSKCAKIQYPLPSWSSSDEGVVNLSSPPCSAFAAAHGCALTTPMHMSWRRGRFINLIDKTNMRWPAKNKNGALAGRRGVAAQVVPPHQLSGDFVQTLTVPAWRQEAS
jgi:hypothetical protein